MTTIAVVLMLWVGLNVLMLWVWGSKCVDAMGLGVVLYRDARCGANVLSDEGDQRSPYNKISLPAGAISGRGVGSVWGRCSAAGRSSAAGDALIAQ